MSDTLAAAYEAEILASLELSAAIGAKYPGRTTSKV